MKKIKYFIIILVFTSLITSCIDEDNFKNRLYRVVEQSYFRGQVEALENDIRVRKNKDSCWVWAKSPWGDGREPIYHPPIDCNEYKYKYDI